MKQPDIGKIAENLKKNISRSKYILTLFHCKPLLRTTLPLKFVSKLAVWAYKNSFMPFKSKAFLKVSRGVGTFSVNLMIRGGSDDVGDKLAPFFCYWTNDTMAAVLVSRRAAATLQMKKEQMREGKKCKAAAALAWASQRSTCQHYTH